MSFGLCNTLATFQATMNEFLKSYLCRFIAVVFDDILIYSPLLDSHLIHLEGIFKLLAQNKFHLYKNKCLFAKNEL